MLTWVLEALGLVEDPFAELGTRAVQRDLQQVVVAPEVGVDGGLGDVGLGSNVATPVFSKPLRWRPTIAASIRPSRASSGALPRAFHGKASRLPSCKAPLEV